MLCLFCTSLLVSVVSLFFLTCAGLFDLCGLPWTCDFMVASWWICTCDSSVSFWMYPSLFVCIGLFDKCATPWIYVYVYMCVCIVYYMYVCIFYWVELRSRRTFRLTIINRTLLDTKGTPKCNPPVSLKPKSKSHIWDVMVVLLWICICDFIGFFPYVLVSLTYVVHRCVDMGFYGGFVVDLELRIGTFP